MEKHFIKLILIVLMGFCTNCSTQEDIKLELNYKQGEKKTYTVKETVFNYKNLDYIFLRYNEKNIEFEMKSVDKDSIYNLDFNMITYKYIDSTQRKLIKYDSSKSESEMITSEAKRTHSRMKEEYGKKYKISIFKNGEIEKPFAELNGNKPRSGVFKLNLIQLIFPSKKIGLGETWNYEKNGIFYPYHKSQISCSLKEISTNTITIEFNSKVIFDDSRQPVIEKGEYTLDKESYALKYARIESKLDTGANGIFEVTEK